MGQNQSQPDSCQAHDLSKVEGFQVSRLLPHSPAHQAGLVPYFDIIIAADHHNLKQDDTSPLSFFKSYISSHAGHPICLTVFNLRLRSYREVYFISSEEWIGGGLLGCSIQWARADRCLKQCWHITDIVENTPAASCPDLYSNRVYIIGMQDTSEQVVSLFINENDLSERFSLWQDYCHAEEERCNHFPNEAGNVSYTILLLIYDIEENSVKEVVVDMGPDYRAPIGFVVSSGLLHMIPAVEDGDIGSLPIMNQFFLPQDLAFETDYPADNCAQKAPSPPEVTVQIEPDVESHSLLQQNTPMEPPRDASPGDHVSDGTQGGLLKVGGLHKPVGSLGPIPPPPPPLMEPQETQRGLPGFGQPHPPTHFAGSGSVFPPKDSLGLPHAFTLQDPRDHESFHHPETLDGGSAVRPNFERSPLDLLGMPAPLEFPLFSNPLAEPPSSKRQDS